MSSSELETQLAEAIALVHSQQNYEQANDSFASLLARIETESPTTAPLIKRIWEEFVRAHRSATFYESLSDAEAGLADKMAKNSIQLKQNYLRLVQEQ
jgi:hypothetical protein